LVGQLEREIQLQRTLLDAEQGYPASPAGCGRTRDVARRRLRGCSRTRTPPAAHPDGRGFAATGAELVTDPVLLGRVLVNMVKNAFEATPAGGQVRLWCERESSPNGTAVLESGDALAFHVHNPGRDSARSRRAYFPALVHHKAGTGHGLGTYSMKLLGERYLGGKVSFTTGAEAGTVFSIRLPLPAAVGAGI